MFKDKFISLKEAAEISGYSPDYIGQLIRKGKLPGKQVFSHVSWMTTRDAVEEYMRASGKSASPAKFSNIRESLMASRSFAAIFRVVVSIAIAAAVFLIIVLFYILSVSIDHKINQQYLEKIEHVQE